MEPVLVRLICVNCGYRAAPGMGYCLRCDTLNPDYEEEEIDADRDLGSITEA